MNYRILTFIIVQLLIHMGPAEACGQEIQGPQQSVAGSLVVFEIVPSQKSAWTVVSDNGIEECFDTSETGAKICFATPSEGRYTIIAAIAEDGSPKILTKEFYNGSAPAPKPGPEPPVPPTPELSLETWIKTQLPLLVKSKNLRQESQEVADGFRQIVKRIETGNIKTASNAQTQLRIALVSKLALASSTAVTDWEEFLKQLSQEMNKEIENKTNDINAIKAVFARVGDSIEPAIPQAAVQASCSTGQCPSNLRTPSGTRYITPTRVLIQR